MLLVEVLQMMETLILSSLRAMFSWTVSTRSGVITIHFQVQFYSKFVIIIKKNGREPLNNQNIINQATDKMKLTGEHVSSFVDMEIYNLLPSYTKKHGKH